MTWSFYVKTFSFLKHQHLIALHSPQTSYFFSEVKLCT